MIDEDEYTWKISGKTLHLRKIWYEMKWWNIQLPIGPEQGRKDKPPSFRDRERAKVNPAISGYPILPGFYQLMKAVAAMAALMTSPFPAVPVKYLHYGNLCKLTEDSIGATHTKLNGIVKAVPSFPPSLAYSTSCAVFADQWKSLQQWDGTRRS